MQLLRRSLGSQITLTSDTCERDSRVESSEDSEPATSRPATSDARIEGSAGRQEGDGQGPGNGEGRAVSTVSVVMPSIRPIAMSSSAHTSPVAKVSTARRSSLPMLGHNKSLATLVNANGEPEVGAMALMDGDMDTDTEEFKKAMWAGQANILVAVRVRPHCSHDRDTQGIVKVLDNKMVVIMDKAPPPLAVAKVNMSPLRHMDPLGRRHSNHPMRKLRNTASPTHSTQSGGNNYRSREKRYAFDYVFSPEDSQQTVYQRTTKFLIHGVMNGFNATVFAYGCTGAGKTYTMLGTPEEPGIMALTLEDLFLSITRTHADPQATAEYRVTVSFLEVYNENIRDLLATPQQSGIGPVAAEYLDLREDPVKGPVIAGISEIEASNAAEVMRLLRRGNKNRSQEATAANAVSSRSHAVLQVLVEQREKSSSSNAFDVDQTRGNTVTSAIKYGKLSLVDLAGSERAAVTQNRGLRLLEGANINRSLLALGNCINALGEKASAGAFVPYRDSKLTRLLKDSLGGNCRTVMIANISQATASVEETRNTLKYANRAKNIKTTVTRNVLSVDHHITEYINIIAELKDEIAALKDRLAYQQEQVDSDAPDSPDDRGRAKRRTKRFSNSNNNEVDEEDDNKNAEDEMKKTKLNEARAYIAQCFQQRLNLQRKLFEIGNQIVAHTEELMRLHANKTAGDAAHSDTISKLELESANMEANQNDLALSNFEDDIEPNDSTIQCASTISTTEQLEDGVRTLFARKKQIQLQLENNEKVMDEFRVTIDQTPMIQDEHLRELLFMEYRVGNLQVDNGLLQMKQQHKDTELSQLRSQLVSIGGNATVSPSATSALGTSVAKDLSHQLPGSPVCTSKEGLPPLRSAHQAFASVSPEADDNPETQTSRSASYTFISELKDRFYSDNKGQTSGATNKASNGSPSPHRQWGIHLSNTSLPYIRLKKKSPSPSSKAPPSNSKGSKSPSTRKAFIRANTERKPRVVSLDSVPKSSAAIAAPYLKVLKHRRKMNGYPSSTTAHSPLSASP